MKATLERVPGSRAVLDVQVPPEEMQADIQEAYRRLARRVRIPGFRPGKAPAQLIERMLGRQSVLDEALDPMVNRAYQAAVAECGVSPVERPQIDVKTFEDGVALHFVATVSVRPEVTLPDWSGMEVVPEPSEVKPEDIDSSLAEMRESRASWVPKTEPAEDGDMVQLRTTGQVEGGPRINEAANEAVLGTGRIRVEIEQAVRGQVAGSRLELDLSFPSDDPAPALAGKQAHVQVELLEVRRKELPELDDAFAAEVSEHGTLEELRAELGNRLREIGAAVARRSAELRAVGQVVDGAGLEVPEVLIGIALDNLLAERDQEAARYGDRLEAQLRRAGRTLEQLREELLPTAERRVRTELVLDAVARREGLQVSEADIDAELVRISRDRHIDLAELRRAARQPDTATGLRVTLLQRKAERLLSAAIVKGDPVAPQEEAAASGEEGETSARGTAQ